MDHKHEHEHESEHDPETRQGAMNHETLRTLAASIMDVTGVEQASMGPPGTLQVVGPLRVDPQEAYDQVSERLKPAGYTALLRQKEDNHEQVALLALPLVLEPGRSRLWLALLLFGLTVLSTIMAGGLTPASEAGRFALRLPFPPEMGTVFFDIVPGVAFSATLLSILLAHELGHFLVARRLGVAVSYPFFIPMPLSMIGTMGAFISMKAPPPDRRALFSIAIAGPLAGLVPAIPLLLLGLNLSEVQTPEPPFLLEGNSLLYAALKWAVFGKFLPSGGEDVFLHPVAMAAWVGLLVTGLNLIPAGQLDGGHILYALVGHQMARKVTWGMVLLMLVMGFLWVGWFVWAALIAVLGRFRAPLLNEVTPLHRWQKVLAVVGIIIFFLVFTPVPFTEVR